MQNYPKKQSPQSLRTPFSSSQEQTFPRLEASSLPSPHHPPSSTQSPSSSFSSNCGVKDKPLSAVRRQNDKAREVACLLLLSCLQFSFKTTEISVCRLLMAIQSLWMAVQRLRMCIQSLQTEISLLLLEEFMCAPLRILWCSYGMLGALLPEVCALPGKAYAYSCQSLPIFMKGLRVLSSESCALLGVVSVGFLGDACWLWGRGREAAGAGGADCGKRKWGTHFLAPHTMLSEPNIFLPNRNGINHSN